MPFILIVRETKRKVEIRNKIEKIFGEESLEHAIFYNQDSGLRFELSNSGSYIKMFTTAFNKATEILNSIIGEGEELYVCISFPNQGTLLSNISVFRELKNCQITVPRKKYDAWQKYYPDDEFTNTFMAYKISPDEIHKYLWGALGSELGIEPTFNCKIYFINFKDKILAHPYDDRGMDLIGPNKTLLKKIYETYQSYLLEYDIDKMKEYYSAL